ncbi:autotransporter-associated beta strand repeat-containing protein, partial [Mesorhizobium sp. B2-7-1]|uniref:beta strand repeat-containing protein n=1 Tax=Mesorhizobium sp. B2-7-1 TaxID=2589909 RepID=UPI00116BC3AF
MAGLACGGTIHDQRADDDGGHDPRSKAGHRHPGRASSQARSGLQGQPARQADRSVYSQLLRGGRMTKWKGQAASFAPNLAQLVSTTAPALRGARLPVALLVGLGALPAGAADRYWDVNGTGVELGGIGSWNTSSPFWNESSNGVSGPMDVWNNAAGDNAIFDGTAGAVTLGGSISAGSLTFNVGGYSIGGGTLTLAGATPTVSVAAGTATINSIIAGNAGLTKLGSGTLTLGGANTFVGDVNVNGGTLSLAGSGTYTGNINLNSGFLNVANDAALGNSSNGIFTTAGTQLTINGALSGSRVVTLGAGGQTTIAGVGAASTYYTGAGGLTAFRTSLTNNANDYAGQTTIQVSTSDNITFSSVGNLGEVSALGAGAGSNGTIIVQRINGATGTLSYVGTGSDSNRDWSLPTTGGNLSFVNSGTGTLILRGNIALGGPAGTGVGFAANSADLQLLGQISGSLGSVSFSGSSNTRTITLGDSNSFNAPASIGSVTVKAGVLANGGANSSLGAGTSVNLANGGVLSYTGGAASSNRTWTVSANANGTINNDSTTGALTLSGAATLNTNSTLTFGGSYTGGPNTFSGVISGSGNLASNGAGVWELTGASTRTGGITVDGGTLRAGSALAFGTTTTVTVNNGTLDLNNFNLAATSLAGTGGTIALGSGTLTVNSASGGTTFAGSITGTGGLTKQGASTLTLTGANTYNGTTNVSGGTLALDFSAASAPATDIISSASTLNMAGGTLKVTGSAGQTQSFAATNITAGGNTIAGSGNVTLNLGAINRSSGLVNFVLPTTGSITTTPSTVLGGWATVTTGVTTDYAQVDGAGNIIARVSYATKDDAGTWITGDVVSDEGGNANTPYFGAVGSNVQLGGLKYTVARSSTVTIGVGNTLGVDGTIIVSSSVGNNAQTITGGQLTGPAGGGTLGVLQNSTGNYTIASTIVDNGGGGTGFTKAGTGLVTLSGSNTYSGATIVSGGTLSVNTIANGGSASAIGASSNASSNLVLEGSTLRYTGLSTASDRGFTLVTNGAVTAGTIDVTQAGTDLQFSGAVTSPDNSGLTKTGLGTLTLSNASNNYVGITTVNQGTLAASTLANGGANSSIGASSNASSNLVLQSGGELEYLGATASSNRGFTLASGGGAIGVAQTSTTLTLSGVATGAGSLTKNGTGTLILSGTNDYTGGTIVSAGTLRAGSTSAFGTGLMTVNTGATLDLAGRANTVRGLSGTGNVLLGAATLTTNGSGSFSGSISGTGGVTIAPGTVSQTFAGCGNSYTGPTTIQSGTTLNVSCLANGGLQSDIGSSGSASTNLVFINGTLNYTGGTVTTDRGFSMPGFVGGAIGVQNAATTLTFGGQVTGSNGGVSKFGAGTLVLSGTNNYGGGTTVTAGTLRAGSTSAFGTGGMAVNTGATLDLANLSNTVGSLAGGGNVTLGSATLTISNGASQNFSGAISGTGGLVKSGAGTQTLSGVSSYTGSTVINGGILAVTGLANGGSNSSIGSSAATPDKLVLNGGTLQYIGTGDSTNRLFTLGASGGSLDASGTGAVSFTNTGAAALSGAGNRTLTLTGTNTAGNSLAARIDNPAGATTALTKTGTGTWVLKNGSSTYTGATTISGGVLAVDKLGDGGQASSIGQSTNLASNLVIGSGSTLRYTGGGDTTDRLFT